LTLFKKIVIIYIEKKKIKEIKNMDFKKDKLNSDTRLLTFMDIIPFKELKYYKHFKNYDIITIKTNNSLLTYNIKGEPGNINIHLISEENNNDRKNSRISKIIKLIYERL
jgi:hypothetical protein